VHGSRLQSEALSILWATIGSSLISAATNTATAWKRAAILKPILADFLVRASAHPTIKHDGFRVIARKDGKRVRLGRVPGRRGVRENMTRQCH
jgi:hypothetical protein